MHEASLVRSLLNQVESVCRSNGGTAVICIEVEVGPLTGVEPLLVREAFELLAPGTDCEGADLVIREVPLSAECRVCGAEFSVDQLRFECPGCGSTSVRVTHGDEFRLLNVILETDTVTEASA